MIQATDDAKNLQDWQAYYQTTANRPPRITTRFALDRFAAEGRVGQAIDIGCGSGNDVAAMLDAGWQVLAIDPLAECIAFMQQRFGNHASLQLQQAGAAGFAIPPVDLVNASYALPFCTTQEMPDIWRKIRQALQPGARFAGQFFGINDTWKREKAEMSFYDRAGVEGLLQGLEVEMFEESEEDKPTALGVPKHWHVFDIVARQP